MCYNHCRCCQCVYNTCLVEWKQSFSLPYCGDGWLSNHVARLYVINSSRFLMHKQTVFQVFCHFLYLFDLFLELVPSIITCVCLCLYFV